MNNPDWTVERVRSELPDVRVVHNGRESFAVVRGRLLAFARLSTDEVPGSHRLRAMRQAMAALTDADTFLTETHKGDYLCGKLALTIHKAMVALERAGL